MPVVPPPAACPLLALPSPPSPINGVGNDIVESCEAIGIDNGIRAVVVCELSETENRLEIKGLLCGCGCDWGRGRCFLGEVVGVVGDDLRIKERGLGKPALKYLFFEEATSLASPPPAPAPVPAHKTDIPSGI